MCLLVRWLAVGVKNVGAGGRNRTDTSLRTRDFESRASASFTTPAWGVRFYPIKLRLRLEQRRIAELLALLMCRPCLFFVCPSIKAHGTRRAIDLPHLRASAPGYVSREQAIIPYAETIDRTITLVTTGR